MKPCGTNGILIYMFMVDLYVINVGKYTSLMDSMG